MSHYKVGSNQYKRKANISWHGKVGAYVILLVLTLTILHYIAVGVTTGTHATKDWAKKTFDLIAYAPTVYKVYASEKNAGNSAVLTPPTPTPTETDTQYQMISEYIQQVFGVDSPKAFKLLSCENHALNPEAVNTAGNFPAGSRDIGVFQINEYWQKTQAAFLFDYRINVDIAHNIYTRSGNSFDMWSCGKRMGI